MSDTNETRRPNLRLRRILTGIVPLLGIGFVVLLTYQHCGKAGSLGDLPGAGSASFSGTESDPAVPAAEAPAAPLEGVSDPMLDQARSMILTEEVIPVPEGDPKMDLFTPIALIPFADPDLRACLLASIARGPDPSIRFAEQVLSLECLDNYDISNLAGIEYLSNLKGLGLYSTATGTLDLTPIGMLRNLTVLLIGRSAVKDLTPIGDLPNLGYLFLYGTEVGDISVLSSAPRLKSIALHSNSRLSDLAALAKFPSLSKLSIGYQEYDLSQIAELRNITNLTLFTMSPPNTLWALAKATQLTDLWITRGGITDIAPLAGLTSLEFLQLNENNIVDLGPLKNLSRLRELSLDSNSISDLRPLAGLVLLEELGLSNNPSIRDISPLYGLTALRMLGLHGNTNIRCEQFAELQQRIPGVWIQSPLVCIIDPTPPPNLCDSCRVGEACWCKCFPKDTTCSVVPTPCEKIDCVAVPAPTAAASTCDKEGC